MFAGFPSFQPQKSAMPVLGSLVGQQSSEGGGIREEGMVFLAHSESDQAASQSYHFHLKYIRGK